MKKNPVNNMIVYAWVAPILNNCTVLDVGCGCGVGLTILSNFSLKQYGADFSTSELNRASKKQYYCPTTLYQVDLENEWVGGFYDVITCFETIEHLDNPEFVLEKIYHSCDKFIFSVPVNSPARYHKQLYKTIDEIKQIVEPHFTVDWYFQRKTIIQKEKFISPQRFIGIATPKK